MRFGILSTAQIACNAMLPAIEKSDHEVVAIASRDLTRAERVAGNHSIPNAYGNYEDFLASDIDAIYNPLPPALHAKWTKRAADSGIDVLCEKPLTTDAESAVNLFEYCADADVTLMEAFMYQFHPRTKRAHQIVDAELGAVQSVDATFKFRQSDPPGFRYDSDLGGGVLLDAGCYPVSAVRNFLGEPLQVFASSTDRHDRGIETDITGILKYDEGQIGSISTSFDTASIQRYRVESEEGFLEAENCFVPGRSETELTYAVNERTVTETFDSVDQYQLEIEHFAECATKGTIPHIDRGETVSNMQVLDALTESSMRERPITVR